MSPDYEAVIGLEVHVQIATASKLFSRVPAGFGHEPNTLTDPVILALPGALPLINHAALDAVIKAGLLLDCEIAAVCKWDRKNYFYPDSPKNYQISQYDQPICRGGSVEIELAGSARNVIGEHKKIPLTRIHLEEDVGKLQHTAFDSLVDFNRAGTPLMEIVSEPALQSAAEAYAYLNALRAMMIYGGISDCDMEKGQLRCDANISIRPRGQTELGTKVELKNLNSISYVRDGIAHEIARQLAVVSAGGKISQETRDYDGETGKSQSLRSKEMAHDYRYFPDPDLMPVRVDEAWISRLRESCPERPFDKQRRFFTRYNLPYTSTAVLIGDEALANYFEAAVVVAGKERAHLVANWVVNDLLRELGTAQMAVAQSPISPPQLAELVKMLDAGSVLAAGARTVFAEMAKTGAEPAEIAARLGLQVTATDANELDRWCQEAIAANPKALADFKTGKESALNAFKGPVMKAAKGKVAPPAVDAALRRILATLP